MAASGPLPIFKSAAQERLLTHLFVTGEGAPESLSAISQRTGISISTVQREVDALDRAGLVTSHRIGAARLVAANEQSQYYADLRSLLTKAFGPAHVLEGALRNVPGVRRALIFGSWARRHHGEPGPAPRDLDVLVVGEPAVEAVYRAARDAERVLDLEVNPIVVSDGEWESPVGLLRRIRAGKLVELDLDLDRDA